MLKLQSISKTFAPRTYRELTVLDDVSLDVAEAEFVVLLGNNGAGKSTLLRIIAGELEPDNGKVLLNDVDLSDLPAYSRSKYLSYIRQSREYNLVANLTVAEVFMLAMSNMRSLFSILLQHRMRDQIASLLASLKQGLENRINEQISSLSGGEHQLVTILVAAELVSSNKLKGNLLLLDEHVAHLDPASSKNVMALTTELVQKYGLTTLMVTHNIQIASEFGNRVLILKDHKIVFDRKYITGEKRDPTELYDAMIN